MLVRRAIALSGLSLNRMMFLTYRRTPTPLNFAFHTNIHIPTMFSTANGTVLSALSVRAVRSLCRNVFPRPLAPGNISGFTSLSARVTTVRSDHVSLSSKRLHRNVCYLNACVHGTSNGTITNVTIDFLRTRCRSGCTRIDTILVRLTRRVRRHLNFGRRRLT